MRKAAVGGSKGQESTTGLLGLKFNVFGSKSNMVSLPKNTNSFGKVANELL
ncbi:hypothetical protein FCV25MIE_16553, partial [Fagus crenata]